jgi:hypothetical protein
MHAFGISVMEGEGFAIPISGDIRVKVILRKPGGVGETNRGRFVEVEDRRGEGKVGGVGWWMGRGEEMEGKFEW